MKKPNLFKKVFRKVADKIVSTLSEVSLDTEYDEPGYRRITEDDAKGLDIVQRDRQLRIVFKLYLTNFLARTIVDTINDFVFGNGFTFTIESKNKRFPKRRMKVAQEICNDFWKVNKLDLKLKKKGGDLSLNGMLLMPAFVNEVDGSVKLGFVDPLNINKVITNPYNIEDVMQVDLKPKDFTTENPSLTIIRKKEEKEFVDDADFELLDGEAFFFTINNVSNQPEGISDLLTTADMLDMFQHLLENILNHSELSYLYFEDIKIIGADEKQIKAYKKNNPIGKGGSRRIHNEKVEHELVTPDIKASNSAEIVRMFKNLVLMSKRMPEMWFTEGGETNLATATAQGTPIYKLLEERQEYWKYIIEEMLTFVLHKAFNKKQGFEFSKEELLSLEVKVSASEVEQTNMQIISEALIKVVDIIQKAVTNKWISEETAGKWFRSYPDLIGFDIDDTTEKIQLEKEAEEKEKNKEESTLPNDNDPELNGDTPLKKAVPGGNGVGKTEVTPV